MLHRTDEGGGGSMTGICWVNYSKVMCSILYFHVYLCFISFWYFEVLRLPTETSGRYLHFGSGHLAQSRFSANLFVASVRNLVISNAALFLCHIWASSRTWPLPRDRSRLEISGFGFKSWKSWISTPIVSNITKNDYQIQCNNSEPWIFYYMRFGFTLKGSIRNYKNDPHNLKWPVMEGSKGK